jgi:hypothetical protein
VEKEIKKVNSAIKNCEGEIKIAASNVLQSAGEDMQQYWMKEVQALRAEKNALLTEKSALRAKENALMAEKKPVNEANLLPKYSEGI